MFTPVAHLVPGAVAAAGHLHFQQLVNRVGPITKAEVDDQIPAAARIHAREWDATPHPLDPLVPPEAHDWAIRHIAANLVARGRGYDYSTARLYRMQPPPRELELAPARRTEDWSPR